MLECKNDFIKKYKYDKYEDYVIYIKETSHCYEYYLQNEKYGIIALMFGVNKEETTLEDFMQIIVDIIGMDIKYYKKEYEDKD